MSNERRETWINMCFRDEQLADFMAVKQYLGLQHNTDVIRLLVRREARAIGRAQAGPAPDAPPLPQAAPGEPPTSSEPDARCLTCLLPVCDRTDPRCP